MDSRIKWKDFSQRCLSTLKLRAKFLEETVGDEINGTVDEVLMCTIVFHMFCLPSSWMFSLTNHVKKRKKIHITQQPMYVRKKTLKSISWVGSIIQYLA